MTDRVFTQLTVPLSAVSVLLLGLGVGAAWYIHDMQRRSTNIVENHMASVRAAYELELSVREMRRYFFRYMFYRDHSILQFAREPRDRIEHWLLEVKRLANTDEEKALVEQIYNGCGEFFEQFREHTANLPPAEQNDQLTAAIDQLLVKKVYAPIDAFQKLNETALSASYRDNEKLAGRLILGLIGVGVCGAAGGILVGMLITSSIRRSMLRTEKSLRSTAEQLSRVAGEPTPKPAPPPEAGELDAAVQSVSVSAAAVIERLDRSQRDALRAEQLAYVGQMAAGIAHEVRNPLTAIKILVQKAGERRAHRPFVPRDLEVLEDEIERVEQIVNQFLDFARPPRIDKHVLEAHPLLELVVNRLAVRLEQQRVVISCVAPVDPVFIDVDNGQFQQVVYNLLVNALDSLPAGGLIEVVVAEEFSDPTAPHQAVICVKDNGRGLPEGLGDRIFEPFISSKESGLGLGLSICKRIVEAHGGSIRAADGPRGGAEFTVKLPMVEAPALVAVS